jgi:hypothetical protein
MTVGAEGALAFAYTEAWLVHRRGAFPLSLTMPLETTV